MKFLKSLLEDVSKPANVLVILAFFSLMSALILIAQFYQPTSLTLKAAQPTRVTPVIYNQGPLMIYCETPNGNEVYVVSTTSGVGVYVVPGGCK